MVEAPLELQKKMTLPQNHIDVCKAGDAPYKGNAAGNTIDALDLNGQNLSPAPLPAGFTAKGIVALVFSCVAAFLGLAVIAWYVYYRPQMTRFPAALSCIESHLARRLLTATETGTAPLRSVDQKWRKRGNSSQRSAAVARHDFTILRSERRLWSMSGMTVM